MLRHLKALQLFGTIGGECHSKGARRERLQCHFENNNTAEFLELKELTHVINLLERWTTK